MTTTTQPATNGTNRIPAIGKTAETRKIELFKLVSDAVANVPDNIIQASDALAGMELSLGGLNVFTLPDNAPRPFVHKQGARKGLTSYSMFDNRYDPIVLKSANGVTMAIRLSITAQV